MIAGTVWRPHVAAGEDRLVRRGIARSTLGYSGSRARGPHHQPLPSVQAGEGGKGDPGQDTAGGGELLHVGQEDRLRSGESRDWMYPLSLHYACNNSSYWQLVVFRLEVPQAGQGGHRPDRQDQVVRVG